jgi:hypothetical protein
VTKLVARLLAMIALWGRIEYRGWLASMKEKAEDEEMSSFEHLNTCSGGRGGN